MAGPQHNGLAALAQDAFERLAGVHGGAANVPFEAFRDALYQTNAPHLYGDTLPMAVEKLYESFYASHVSQHHAMVPNYPYGQPMGGGQYDGSITTAISRSVPVSFDAEQIKEIVQRLLKEAGNEGGFWSMDTWQVIQDDLHYVREFHYETRPELVSWMLESSGFVFKRGEGMPGRVLATCQPEFTDNLQMSHQNGKPFLRFKMASKLGITTVLGVPIRSYSDNTVTHVLAFYGGPEIAKNDSHRIWHVMQKLTSHGQLAEWLRQCSGSPLIKPKKRAVADIPDISLDDSSKRRRSGGGGGGGGGGSSRKCPHNGSEECDCRACIRIRRNRELSRREQRRRKEALEAIGPLRASLHEKEQLLEAKEKELHLKNLEIQMLRESIKKAGYDTPPPPMPPMRQESPTEPSYSTMDAFTNPQPHPPHFPSVAPFAPPPPPHPHPAPSSLFPHPHTHTPAPGLRAPSPSPPFLNADTEDMIHVAEGFIKSNDDTNGADGVGPPTMSLFGGGADAPFDGLLGGEAGSPDLQTESRNSGNVEIEELDDETVLLDQQGARKASSADRAPAPFMLPTSAPPFSYSQPRDARVGSTIVGGYPVDGPPQKATSSSSVAASAVPGGGGDVGQQRSDFLDDFCGWLSKQVSRPDTTTPTPTAPFATSAASAPAAAAGAAADPSLQCKRLEVLESTLSAVSAVLRNLDNPSALQQMPLPFVKKEEKG
ncbi:unnamed protein product [Vitrella brassicaformis CCMP3155]|uniref:BZIP domain-containing protein n=2 Tax=Vitrella brassicaformis TaxID=1169539 RepID=A0A0G4FM01_VITBC|nr:unnamed protein product [Vitrella brassicaformis CCMP3155]|eukprot:CEM14964.1 unnamed protein product [Vitrella brassicaformis CCMP3155]